MIIRAIDIDGDWTFGKGLEDYKSGRDAIVQSIQTRLLSFYQDCFFDNNFGIDWFNLIGRKNILAVQLAVSAMILNTPNIVSGVQVSVNLDVSRVLTIKYIANTVYGLVNQTVILSPVNYLTTQSGEVLTDQDGNPIVI